jgi:hypothetical protein
MSVLFDRQNLEFSAMYLLASLTKKFRQDVLNSVGLEATGIQVFIDILHCKMNVVISLQRQLIRNLEVFDISQQEGGNTPEFNVKVQELCQAFEQAGEPPK